MYTMDLYQQAALRSRNNDLDPFSERMMLLSGLASETGEIAEAIKQSEFHGHPLDHDNLKKELGDLLWYLSGMAHHFGWTLEEIASRNIEKLQKRYPNGFNSNDSINRIENAHTHTQPS
jgi:NTP pyrophosphatase (non-canonical NTP hydrolase)